MDIPCVKECPDRTEDCHGHCERYAAYAAWRKEEREKKQKRAEEEAALNHGRRRRYAVKMYNENHKKE